MPKFNEKWSISIITGKKSRNNNQYLLLVSKDILVFSLDNSVKLPVAIISLLVL